MTTGLDISRTELPAHVPDGVEGAPWRLRFWAIFGGRAGAIAGRLFSGKTGRTVFLGV